jgi:Tfp pilus assembly protein PilN
MVFRIASAGIEFQEERIRISLVDRTLKETRYVGSETVQIDRTGISGSELDKSIASSIREVFHAHRWKPKVTVFSIPRTHLIVKSFEIPPVEEANVRQMLEFELEKHIPFLPEEIYFDYYLKPGKSEDAYSVFLLAMPKEVVDRYITILEWAGLTPNVLQPTPSVLLEIVRAEQSPGEDQFVSAFMCDSSGIEVDIFQNRSLVMSKYFSIEESRWRNTLTGTDTDEPGRTDREYICSTIEKAVWQTILSLDIQTDFSSSRKILYGDCQNLPDVKSSLSAKGWEIVEPESFVKICTNISRDFQVERFLPSLFLALRGLERNEQSVNLLPPEMEMVKSDLGLYITYTLVILIALFGISTLVTGNLKLRNAHARLNAQIDELTNEVEYVMDMKEELDTNQQLIDTYRDFNIEQPYALDILKNLTEITPDSIWLDNLRIRKGELQIRGYAESTAEFIKVLEQSKYFENVEEQHRRESSRSRYRGIDTESMIRFTITADVIEEQ